jgi:hypothetical protein
LKIEYHVTSLSSRIRNKSGETEEFAAHRPEQLLLGLEQMLDENPHTEGNEHYSAGPFRPLAKMNAHTQAQPRTHVRHDQSGEPDDQRRRQDLHSKETQGHPHRQSINTRGDRKSHQAPTSGGVKIPNAGFLSKGLSDHIEAENNQYAKGYPVVEASCETRQTFSAQPPERCHHCLEEPEVPS